MKTLLAGVLETIYCVNAADVHLNYSSECFGDLATGLLPRGVY